MSDAENFIARWSRRKREAVQESEKVSEKESEKESEQESQQESQRATGPDGNAAKSEQPPQAATAQGAEFAFDVASLPPLDSITAATDIRAFLAPGVPAELTRAALRRAWAADPNIRDFVGLSENAWNFNDPGTITGFGPLEMTDELRRQIARMVGRSLTDATEEPRKQGEPEVSAELAADAGSPTDASIGTALSQDESVKCDSARYNSSAIAQREEDHTATQNIPVQPDSKQARSDNEQLIEKRPHGRALPK
jgi:uncharacterized protein DUF3306